MRKVRRKTAPKRKRIPWHKEGYDIVSEGPLNLVVKHRRRNILLKMETGK